jgi:multidrug efflux pump subunit AcrA (membrane-fusion protein)
MSMLRNLIVLVAGLAAACSKQAPPAPPPPAVTVTTVSERDVQEWDEFQGRIEATDNVEIRPRVSGYVEEVRFAEGKSQERRRVRHRPASVSRRARAR